MRSIFLEKSCTKCGWETSPRPFSEKLKLSISLDQVQSFLQFAFVVWQVEGYCNISKLSCRPLAFTSTKHFKKTKRKNICYILLIDQISLSGCLYFQRYWAICVLQLFVNQVVTSGILKLTLSFYSNRFSYPTWPKGCDKNLNILKIKRAFKMK